ncbi:hypothetical protein MACJ_003294 [Theileria orientalis]|uniref:RRM domain-containing protein n=1 Tax=Theileria orientalis TaxID=68886 RepID=A0A976QT14_THEOR|nr:hypothetical protein MACJ_003294 [Theileria orientalis]
MNESRESIGNNWNNHSLNDLDCLKQKLIEDPWDQDLYTEAIHLASTQNDYSSLDYFRNEFFKHCIVDDDFWISYIEEKKASLTKDAVIELYKFAAKNEPSVYIWLSYLRFVFENSHTFSEYNDLRQLFETSLEVLGLHALDGPQLWSEYRLFEQKLLSKVQKDDYTEQIERIRSLFYRQLKIPLAGLPDLLDEYLVWEEELPVEYRKSIDKGEDAHKIGFEAWELRKCFELKIQSDFHEMMSRDNMNSLWNDYIDFELKCGDMPRIMMVYHRAMDYLGYERDDLWINYANYALQTSYAKSLSVCERACKHMPRSLNIWINYFLVVSSKSENVQDIVDLLNKANTAIQDIDHKISLHITAADCVRRIDLKDVYNCRFILSKCAELNPEYTSRAVYRLLTYWTKYELKLLSFNIESEYVKVVEKLFEKFKGESFCWLYLIDTVKGLNPESPYISNIVSHIYRGYSSLVDFNSEFEPTTLHTLVIWLYELSLSVVNVNDLADEYIDYVQSSGVVEDIKRAHKVVAAHSTPTSRPYSSSSRSDSLSLNSLIKRDRRRRKLETFSETSSDSGSHSSWVRRPQFFSSGLRSPILSMKESDSLRSPKMGYRDFSSKDSEPRSSRLTLKDLETVTRATWDGYESAEPSIAPAVPPNAPMPPPSSPVISRITSRLSNSGSCTPDLTPEFSVSKGSNLPPPLVLSGHFNNESGSDCLKLSDTISNSDYKLNFSTADSESLAERLSSDTESQSDRFESPTIKSPLRPTALCFNQLSESPMSGPAPVDSDTSVMGGHFLLSKKECVMNWLSCHSENSTVFVSGFDFSQILELKEFFSKQPGFIELRPVPKRNCCYVEFTTNKDATFAIEASKTLFKDSPTISAKISKPTKPLFEDRVVFVRVLNNKYTLSKLKSVMSEFFKTHGYEAKDIRTTRSQTSPKITENDPSKQDSDFAYARDEGSSSEKCEKLGCYVEFGFDNASRLLIHKLINEYGWPIYVNYSTLDFQVLPSIPIVHTANRNESSTETDRTARTEASATTSVGSNELYICNLNYKTDENGLKGYLEQNFGPVKSLSICRDSNGNSKGYAFVEFEDDVYTNLIKSSLVLDDRRLYVSRSNSQGRFKPQQRSTQPQDQTPNPPFKAKYKRKYTDYKSKVVETYSKLKKRIKLD